MERDFHEVVIYEYSIERAVKFWVQGFPFTFLFRPPSWCLTELVALLNWWHCVACFKRNENYFYENILLLFKVEFLNSLKIHNNYLVDLGFSIFFNTTSGQDQYFWTKLDPIQLLMDRVNFLVQIRFFPN